MKKEEDLRILNEVGNYAMMGLSQEDIDAQTAMEVEKMKEKERCNCKNCTCGKK